MRNITKIGFLVDSFIKFLTFENPLNEKKKKNTKRVLTQVLAVHNFAMTLL